MLLRTALACLLLSTLIHAQGSADTPAAPAAATGGRGGASGGGGAATPAAGAAGAGAGGAAQGSDTLIKALEIQKWYMQLGDIAEVDEIRYTSAPPHRASNPTAPGAKNPLIIHAMTFIPKNLDRTKKQPLIVFAHQGIHSDFGHDYEYGVVKDLVRQGYSVIGPDYRGSTGYGTGFSNQIDYGGLEVDDVFNARAWMLENYDFLDPKRVGMMGWSHGGFITLMNILQHPGSYAVAYAGVPVTDLVLRLGYHDAAYQQIFSAQQHIGKPVSGDIQEYLKRSPITYADKLETPLLIHGNTNDEDVNVIEVQRFVTALKAAGKKFEYKIYDNAPGGHEFGRLDTKLAKDSRHEVYVFLAQYLKPERPVK
jgi:dipeptidyl aminopeptidase/acylaminoacyl peptidase